MIVMWWFPEMGGTPISSIDGFSIVNHPAMGVHLRKPLNVPQTSSKILCSTQRFEDGPGSLIQVALPTVSAANAGLAFTVRLIIAAVLTPQKAEEVLKWIQGRRSCKASA